MTQTRPEPSPARAPARIAISLVALAAALLLPIVRERLNAPPISHGDPKGGASSGFVDEDWRAVSEALEAIALAAPQNALPTAQPRNALLFAPPSSPLLDSPAGKSAFALLDYTPPPDLAALVGGDAQGFAQALAAYRAGDLAAGDAAVATLRNPLAVATAQWVGLRLHPREAGFRRIMRFTSEHPEWPAADWLRRQAEESLYAERASDATVTSFFAQSKPLTGAGGAALARALAHAGDFEGAATLVRRIWRENDFSESFESALTREFGDLLFSADHKYRADRLAYAEKYGQAARAAALAGPDIVNLERLRAEANANFVDDRLFVSLPPALRKDPGLLLARIHLLRKRERIADAAALMLDAPRDPALVIDGDAWWTERRLVARKLLDMGDAKTAYQICADHMAKSVSSKVEAEFHAGWIALRFLNDPGLAEKHFDAIGAIAETPSQFARANYWRARAFEAQREDERARELYEEASAHSTTFYGQLATSKLGMPISPLRPAPYPAQGDERAEAVRAVELLLAAGEKEAGLALATESMRHLQGGSQLAALAAVAARSRDARLSLNLGKLAATRGVALDDMAFPSYGVPSFSTLPGSAPRSIVYAIARQESAFDPHAISSAGAMGLMQMIASTARNTAGRMGVGFDLRRLLDEPAFNAQLGAAHLGILLGEHKGSYILTFAAYNAGGGRVKEWIDAYGDPRRAGVDPVDWVERIPIQETRNYVQHVMENFVVYRAMFRDHETRPPQFELAHAE